MTIFAGLTSQYCCHSAANMWNHTLPDIAICVGTYLKDSYMCYNILRGSFAPTSDVLVSIILLCSI